MPLQALRTVAKPQNGVGAFILQCKKLEFNYCDHGGSSRGMKEFLQTKLAPFAESNPNIEIIVSPRPNKHPVVRGTYINGRVKPVCVRNLEPHEVLNKAILLKEANGEKLKRLRQPVKSTNESVRGIWSPFHRQPTA